jgi:hypothetical protein
MVIKPWGMGVWDLLRAELDERIRESGSTQQYEFLIYVALNCNLSLKVQHFLLCVQFI